MLSHTQKPVNAVSFCGVHYFACILVVICNIFSFQIKNTTTRTLNSNDYNVLIKAFETSTNEFDGLKTQWWKLFGLWTIPWHSNACVVVVWNKWCGMHDIDWMQVCWFCVNMENLHSACAGCQFFWWFQFRA